MANIFDVAKVHELEPNQGKLLEVNGKEIALFYVDGKFFAVDNECTHVGGPLCEGEVEGTTVICPWHGAEFDLISGKALAPPAEENVNTYKVVVEGDLVKIEI